MLTLRLPSGVVAAVGASLTSVVVVSGESGISSVGGRLGRGGSETQDM